MRGRMWTLAAAASIAAVATFKASAPAQAPAPSPAPAPAATAAATRPAAIVNGETIALAEVDGLLQQDGPKAVALSADKLRELRMATLGMMIDKMLLVQFIRQNGPRVDPVEIDKQLAEMQDELKKQGKTLQDLLRDSNQNEQQLRNAITHMLQLRDYFQSRVSDADVKRFYDENRDFFDQTTVRVSHIVKRLPPQTSEQDREAVRQQLLALRQQIVSGQADFGAVAQKNSECPSAPKGGDLGYIQRKWMVDENFARAAFALQVGQVSELVQTDYGLHLIKVTDRKAGQPSDFAKIKDEVRQVCIMDLQQALLNQLRRSGKIEVNLP